MSEQDESRQYLPVEKSAIWGDTDPLYTVGDTQVNFGQIQIVKDRIKAGKKDDAIKAMEMWTGLTTEECREIVEAIEHYDF